MFLRQNKFMVVLQISIHDITNLDKASLENCEILFRISYRHPKHKTANSLGHAKFNFSNFEISKNLTCSRGLSIVLNENTPIVLGTLKVTLQLGCGRLYFGQELIDAITLNKRNSVVLDSDDSSQHLSDENAFEFRKSSSTHTKEVSDNSVRKPTSNPKTIVTATTPLKSAYFNTKKKDAILKEIKPVKPQISEKEQQILFGFIYISEAQFLSRPLSTYFTCRPFCQDETSSSRLVANSSKPIFNFCQLIPLIYEDDLLTRLRENFMVIEFWEKAKSTDLIIGLTQVPLHPFYLAYRNPVILKYLSNNKLPVIGTDWWEPIYDINNEELLGQAQILTALGTEEQIKNLETERGFRNDIVKAKLKPYTSQTIDNFKQPDYFRIKADNIYRTSVRKVHNHVNLNKNYCSDKSTNTCLSPPTLHRDIPKSKKVDIGVQSDLRTMDSEEGPKKSSPAQEMLGSFINQLLTQKSRNIYVENSTNTDTVSKRQENFNLPRVQTETNINEEVRNTSDLLQSLQNALTVGSTPLQTSQKLVNRPNSFKAHVIINSANQLPCRRKCKSKRTKNRTQKHEENILPSTYVTFETMPDSELKITPIVSKTTGPKWDYRCDVNLPTELLTNNQKRLIFKVWKKSTNTVTSPNMQADTVLGFAAVDLTVLLAGLPNVQGWFNIMDFSGKCNGQINIHVTPLENVLKFRTQEKDVPEKKIEPTPEPDLGETGELLSRALKRKFTELDEITQRLRLRLSEVTNEESDGSNDEVAEQFENDINNLCIEEDFDLINFDEDARRFNQNRNNTDENKPEECILSLTNSSKDCSEMEVTDSKKSSSTNIETEQSSTDEEKMTLDKQLHEGKQRIDTLLEKLTLISAESKIPFSGRYVSGCSINSDSIDTESILKKLDNASRPNIQQGSNFDSLVLRQLGAGSLYSQQLYEGSVYSPVASDSQTPASQFTSNSETSVISNFSDCRLAPDGQGTTSDEVYKKPDA